MANKYHAKRTYSALCDRTFSSKAECRRGEELHLLQLAGEISDLEYQVKFVLCEKPKITYAADFKYKDMNGERRKIYEDTKGVLTRDTRTKLAWLKEKYGISVLLSK